MRRVWAVAERIVPRGVVAATTIISAAVTDPFAMGIYAWAVIAFTFLSAVYEVPLRYCAVTLMGSPGGPDRLRRAVLISGGFGVLLMLVAVWTVSAFAGSKNAATTFFHLSPLVAVPAAQVAAIESTAQLQRFGMWRQISLTRTTASIFGIALGIPATLLTKSIIGASLTICVSEVCYAVLSKYLANHNTKNITTESESDVQANKIGGDLFAFGKTYRSMAAYGAIAWLQGHSERWLLGLWAGTSALGVYSLGSAIARSAGEAIAASQVNILRIDLANSDACSDERIREITRRHLRSVLLITTFGVCSTLLVSNFLLSPLLGPKWRGAFEIVPILALASFPLAVAMSVALVHIHRGKPQLASVAPAICLVFAPLIGIVAVSSLEAAVWIYLARECTLAMIQLMLMGRSAPWREAAITGGIVALGSAAAFAGVLGPY